MTSDPSVLQSQLSAAPSTSAEVATSPMRNRRNLVHRAATTALRTVTGKELPRFRERAPSRCEAARLVIRINPRVSEEPCREADGGRHAQHFPDESSVQGSSRRRSSSRSPARSGVGLPSTRPSSRSLFGASATSLPSCLNGRVQAPQSAVSAELPDALDLLSVSVEAGLGFDGAVQKLTEHMDGPLIEEFELALGEIRIGEGRRKRSRRWRSAARRRRWRASCARSSRPTSSASRSAGSSASRPADSRLKRQLLAEEKAMKAPIKMLFPTVLFIFPSMFLVILGPAFLNLSTIFKF